MVLYSAVSSPLDRSKRFTLSSPGRPVHSDTVLGFSWKHSIETVSVEPIKSISEINENDVQWHLLFTLLSSCRLEKTVDLSARKPHCLYG